MRVTPELLVSVAALAASCALVSPRARAEAPGDRQRAGAAFDEGVARFGRAEYLEAARAFLRADELAPSSTAITNAINAARLASDHLLVARAAERAIARGEALVLAREALAQATTRLARIQVTCDASPCSITLDGAPAQGEHALPGTHVLRAEGPAGAVAEEHLSCVAGASYSVALHPAKKDAPPPPAPERPIAPAPKGLPPAFFFAGLGVTAVLAGVTTWSGIDAIQAKGALPKQPLQAQNDDVLGRAHRTDFLLLGTGLAGLGTAALGVFFTSFRQPDARLVPGVAAGPTGALVTARGSFR